MRTKQSNTDDLLRGYNNLPDVLQTMGFTEMRKGQEPVIASIMAHRDTICILPTATGKCYAPGTPILMFNGDVKAVEHVKVGDKVMGPDSKPRYVTTLHNGTDQMYKVIPKKGAPYVVNSQHELSLRITGMKTRVRVRTGESYSERVTCGENSYTVGDIANVSVTDFLKATKTFRHCAKGWRTGIELPEVTPHEHMPPYILGLWLGDGTRGKASVSKPDMEVEKAMREYAATLPGHYIRETRGPSGCPTFHISAPVDAPKGRGKESNLMLQALRALGVLTTKHIPKSYLWTNRQARLELLAGFLDADGYLEGGGGFDLAQKSKRLSDDIVFLARSLGMWAEAKPCRKGCQTGVVGDYYRIYISGDHMADIPCRIPRRQPKHADKRKTVTNTGISIEPVGLGKFYGFAVDGPDKLFLLSDFTVVHNSACFVMPTLCLGWKAIVFSPLVALMRDQVQGLWRKGIKAAQMSSTQTDAENILAAKSWMNGELQFLYVAPERMANDWFKQAISITKPDIIITDSI